MTDRNETIRECIERLTNRGHAEAAKLLAAMMEPTPVEKLAREMFGHSWKDGDDGRQWDLMTPAVHEPWLRLAAVYVDRIAPAIEPNAAPLPPAPPAIDAHHRAPPPPICDNAIPLTKLRCQLNAGHSGTCSHSRLNGSPPPFEPKSHRNLCEHPISTHVTCTRELGHAGQHESRLPSETLTRCDRRGWGGYRCVRPMGHDGGHSYDVAKPDNAGPDGGTNVDASNGPNSL